MQKPLHLQAVSNIDKTKASRKNTLSEEYSHSHAVSESDEVFSEHDELGGFGGKVPVYPGYVIAIAASLSMYIGDGP